MGLSRCRRKHSRSHRPSPAAAEVNKSNTSTRFRGMLPERRLQGRTPNPSFAAGRSAGVDAASPGLLLPNQPRCTALLAWSDADPQYGSMQQMMMRFQELCEMERHPQLSINLPHWYNACCNGAQASGNGNGESTRDTKRRIAAATVCTASSDCFRACRGQHTQPRSPWAPLPRRRPPSPAAAAAAAPGRGAWRHLRGLQVRSPLEHLGSVVQPRVGDLVVDPQLHPLLRLGQLGGGGSARRRQGGT